MHTPTNLIIIFNNIHCNLIFGLKCDFGAQLLRRGQSTEVVRYFACGKPNLLCQSWRNEICQKNAWWLRRYRSHVKTAEEAFPQERRGCSGLPVSLSGLQGHMSWWGDSKPRCSRSSCGICSTIFKQENVLYSFEHRKKIFFGGGGETHLLMHKT